MSTASARAAAKPSALCQGPSRARADDNFYKALSRSPGRTPTHHAKPGARGGTQVSRRARTRDSASRHALRFADGSAPHEVREYGPAHFIQPEAPTNVKLISRAGREPCIDASPVAITAAETKSIRAIAFDL